MAVEVLDQAAEDGVEVVISWLRPLRPTATADARDTGDELPFTLVTNVVPSKENVETGTMDIVVDVRTLCDKNLGGPDMGHVPAMNEKDLTHRRMLLLARNPLEDVLLSSGQNATIDYVDVFAGQVKQKWDDEQVICYVGRYTIGLSYVRMS